MVTIEQTRFTRAEYMKLPEGFRAELVDGVLIKDPGPSSWHQVLVGRIYLELVGVVGWRRTVVSPIDVFVDDHNVLQPDVLALPESNPIRRGAREVGTPILVVEVLSPSTASRDRDQKVGIYFRAGVAEVWLVNPDTGAAEIHRRGGIAYFEVGDRPESEVIPGFRLDLATLLDL